MGTQQFASGLSPIDTEIITSTRDNTQTIISRGEGLEKYKNFVQRAQSIISASSTLTLLSIAGEGYFDFAYATLITGTPASYNQFEIWVDGVVFFVGSWTTNSYVTGLATKENLYVDPSGYLSVPSTSYSTQTQVANNMSLLNNIIGPNNNYNTSGPLVRLAQPIFFKTSLLLKVANTQATSDTVNWYFSGAVK